MAEIKFGTSGWRSLIAHDFTFANVQLAVQGISAYWNRELKRKKSPIYGRKPVVVLGHDTRFLGPEFTRCAAEVLHANGLEPLLCNRDAPTPVISFSIIKKKAIGGINMTASHNPYDYQGLKFSGQDGAGAPAKVTAAVERNILRLQEKGWTFKTSSTGYKPRTFDPRPAYLQRIRQIIDLDRIRAAKMKIAVELMYGTGRGYLDRLLEEAGVKVTRFHDFLNPLFGGGHPEPNEAGMQPAREAILARKASLGLGLDGDADRFGVVDKDGTFLTPNQILALALYHLKKNRGWSGSVVRTVPTSHQVDAVATLLGVKLHETPVGFKHIGALMESEPVIVGGEESGGLSVKGHVPEKDGILACLLMAELVATERKSLGQILQHLEKQSGAYFTERINIKVDPEAKEALLDKLAGGFEKIGGLRVRQHITTDGHKFLLPDEEWLAFRPSGTEPVFRCYVEARSAKSLAKLQKAAKRLLAL